MYYFRKENAVRYRILVIIFLLSASVRAEETDINKFIEDINKKRNNYSREIKALKNNKPDYDPAKDLSSFQKPDPKNHFIENLFKGVDIKKYQQKPDQNKESQLYYFISFSMPESSLKTAVTDAEKVGAVLVLKGMKNDSMKETLSEIKKYLSTETGGRNIQFQIDPILFQEFNITLVPALALITNHCDSCDKGKMITPPIFGDVSISFALEEMKKHSKQEKKPVIDEMIAKLKKNFYED